MRSPSFAARTAAAVSFVLVAACGSDGGGETDAQPVPGDETFQEGNFDRLPRYPGADDVADPSVEGDVTSQSFDVRTALPRQVMAYFTDELAEAGWTVVDRPEQVGAARTHRGVWQKGGQRLVVSSTESPESEDEYSRTTQYSLSLGPA